MAVDALTPCDAISSATMLLTCRADWSLFQNPIRCLIIRSGEVSKPRDLCLELSDVSENLTGTLLPMYLSNFKAMWKFKQPISRLRDFTRSENKMSYRMLKPEAQFLGYPRGRISTEEAPSPEPMMTQFTKTGLPVAYLLMKFFRLFRAKPLPEPLLTFFYQLESP